MATTSQNVTLIAAMDRNEVIGYNGELPWRLPAELKYFKEATTGKMIVMGRTTYESLGRPLPNRHNVVLTRNAEFRAEGCTVVHSLEEALALHAAERPAGEELMIIGGANVYEQALPLATKLMLTEVDAAVEGDAWWPKTFSRNEWRITNEVRHEADEKNEFSFTIRTYERISG